MKNILERKDKKNKKINSIEVDWFLWEEGEINLKNGIVNHHRTMTIYY